MSRSVHRACAGPVLVALAVLALLGAEARAKGEHVVAVLYFDNNTGDADFDVLQKGFADMMITDLSAVDGITVVERDKLQALLDEIALQERSYFDKETAVRLGKGLGARYAVTGAFHAMKPTLRIDMRMIEVATGQVVVAAQVTGKHTELFDLEQRLVARFVAAMKVRLAPRGRARTRVPDVDTLLDYSRGVDLADQGKYEDASRALSQVISRAPTFALARIKRDQLLARLKAAGARRQGILSGRRVALAERAERALRGRDIGALPQEQAKQHIAYRVLRGRFILRALAKHLSSGRSVRVVKRGHEAKAQRLMKAYYANGRRLLAELDTYAGRFTTTYPNGVTHLDTSFTLPAGDQQRAREAGVDRSLATETREPRRVLAAFLLLGHGYDGSSSRWTMAPPLAELQPRFARIGYKLLHQAWAEADAAAASQPHQRLAAIRALDMHAEALLLRGEREQAIAKLQEILDRYPTSGQYRRYEKRIKQELGLVHSDRVRKLERYAQGLQSCDDMSLRVGLGAVMSRRTRLAGLAAARQTVAEIEQRCRGNPKARRFWSYLYARAALHGARHGDCRLFDAYMQRYLAHGGSRRDAAGYRKNYSNCPAGAP